MKELFLKYWNECYLATCIEYPESIFHIHDIQVLRQKKLYRILGKGDFEISDKYYRDVKYNIIFEQDYKSKEFWISYNKIWSVFQSKYGLNYNQIRDIISGWLKEDSKLSALTPNWDVYGAETELKEDSKLSALTPLSASDCIPFGLKEDSKLSALTPFTADFNTINMLKKDSKLSALTPKVRTNVLKEDTNFKLLIQNY